MKNNSNVPILFNVTLDSSNKIFRKDNEQKTYSHLNDPLFKPPLGPNNHNGLSSFDIYPIQGTIQAGYYLFHSILYYFVKKII
jgi:hypothetical protein